MTQIVNLLLKTGFRLEALEEAMPPEHMMEIPGMPDDASSESSQRGRKESPQGG